MTTKIISYTTYTSVLIIQDSDDMFPFVVSIGKTTVRYKTLGAAKSAITRVINSL